jgi:hypothetical protein
LTTSSYAGVVSRESIRILLTYAGLLRLPVIGGGINSLTPMVAYMRPLFFRASQFCYEFLSFGPTSQPNTSKVSSALQLQSCHISFAMHTKYQ